MYWNGDLIVLFASADEFSNEIVDEALENDSRIDSSYDIGEYDTFYYVRSDMVDALNKTMLDAPDEDKVSIHHIDPNDEDIDCIKINICDRYSFIEGSSSVLFVLHR